MQCVNVGILQLVILNCDLSDAVIFDPVNMPLRAGTGPVLGRCSQHRTNTGPVLAPTGIFTSKLLFVHFHFSTIRSWLALKILALISMC